MRSSVEAGSRPFENLVESVVLELGQAVATSAGNLPYKGIIHVAGINDLWRASELSVRNSVRNALAVAVEKGWRSVAFPVIGAGSGGFDSEAALQIMQDELRKSSADLEVLVVRFHRR